MENPYYRDNLEQILAFTQGRHLLRLAEVKRFTGLVDTRTIRRRFPISADGTISAATLARSMCPKSEKGDRH